MDQNEIDALMQGIDRSGAAPGEEVIGSIPSRQGDDHPNWNGMKDEVEGSPVHIQAADVAVPQFEEMIKGPQSGAKVDLGFVLDIPLTINVELGRNRMLISELLQLGQGSVVELTKLAGEPMDVYVNSRLIARGEVVVVNEKFGVRLTDIVSPAERVNKLK
jgi:flagellar motor switch protein FliN/FliY